VISFRVKDQKHSYVKEFHGEGWGVSFYEFLEACLAEETLTVYLRRKQQRDLPR